MLSAQDNETLTKVGPGTPMGNLLRRHWMPIAGVSEFDTGNGIRPVRLLGENLVLYKDLSGKFGLVNRQCPHRGADLSYGFVENCGIRCNYHGWHFKEDGQCVGMPYEDTVAAQAKFKDKIKIKSYPVAVTAGIIWAYLGPAPAPLVPNWEPFTWGNGFAQVTLADVPCNWLQCQENSIDPIHFEWMHFNWSRRLRDPEAPHGPRHLKVAFDEFDHGFIYKRQREDLPPDHPLWTVGRVCLWPNGFYLGDHFEWRVPIDDENTLSVAWFFNRVPHEQEPFRQTVIPAWRSSVSDPITGRYLTSHVMNQDFVAWVGQGSITDRTQEHLGRSDGGITLIRKRMFADLAAIEAGQDPKGVIRDAEMNKCVPLPIAERDYFLNGLPMKTLQDHPIHGLHLQGFMFQAGQPQEVWDAFRTAMGLPTCPVPAEMPELG